MNPQNQPTKNGKNGAEYQQQQSIQMQQMGSLSMSYPAFTDRLELSEECPPIIIGSSQLSNHPLQEAKSQQQPYQQQQQCIEVTQVQLENNNQYPFPFAIGQTNPVDIDNNNNNNPIIQGIPVLANPLGQLDQEHNRNYKNHSYQDSLRLEKFELERKIKPAIDSFARYSKIAVVVMIVAVISLTTQFIVSATQDNKDNKTQTVSVGGGGVSYVANKENNVKRNLYQKDNNPRILEINTDNKSSRALSQQTQYTSSSSTSTTDKMLDCVYYISVELVMWSASCVMALRSLSKYSVRGISIAIGMVLFSIVPQVLGYVSLASKNNDEGEIFLMILNVFLGFFELLYKLINGVLQAKIVKTHFQQHARQFQGAQMLLMQQPVRQK